MIRKATILFLIVMFCGFSCTEADDKKADKKKETSVEEKPGENALSFTILRTIEHEEESFTQGLLFHKGYLYESTGLTGNSKLKKIDPATGKIIKETDLPADVFGEGMALLNGKLYIITYREQRCLVYDLETFRLEKEFSYYGEGWGLTTNGSELLMSNGTSIIRVIDPATFKTSRSVTVTNPNGPVRMINELEYINGKVWANRWMYDEIISFDPATGKINAVADLSALKEKLDPAANIDVLNGIAYDPEKKEVYATGKLWPLIFVLKFE